MLFVPNGQQVNRHIDPIINIFDHFRLFCTFGTVSVVAATSHQSLIQPQVNSLSQETRRLYSTGLYCYIFPQSCSSEVFLFELCQQDIRPLATPAAVSLSRENRE